MDKLRVCWVCKTNLGSQTCKFCGNPMCLNCSVKGICKKCLPKI